MMSSYVLLLFPLPTFLRDSLKGDSLLDIRKGESIFPMHINYLDTFTQHFDKDFQESKSSLLLIA